MTTPSDLTQPGQALVFSLVNLANPNLQNGALSPTNVTLSAPTALTGDASGKNTSVVLSGIAGQGYFGDEVLYYNRLAIDTDVFAILAPDGASVLDDSTTPFATVADALPALNAAYGLDLQPADISNGATAITGVYPKTTSITMADGSLAYTGTLNLTIADPAGPAMSAMVTSQTLNGLNLPQLQ